MKGHETTIIPHGDNIVAMSAEQYRLWKAAPKLLRACEALADAVEARMNAPAHFMHHKPLAAARAAIAKAKGQSPAMRR